jgi:hypothetical protein
MKKLTSIGKLDLSRETLLPLTSAILDSVRGGFAQKTENCRDTSIPCGQTKGCGGGGGGDTKGPIGPSGPSGPSGPQG